MTHQEISFKEPLLIAEWLNAALEKEKGEVTRACRRTPNSGIGTRPSPDSPRRSRRGSWRGGPVAAPIHPSGPDCRPIMTNPRGVPCTGPANPGSGPGPCPSSIEGASPTSPSTPRPHDNPALRIGPEPPGVIPPGRCGSPGPSPVIVTGPGPAARSPAPGMIPTHDHDGMIPWGRHPG